jgi:hypothetical protein
MTSVKVVVSRSICAIFSEEFAEIFVRTTKRPPRTQGICAPASQQHFSLRTNHPPSISQQCFSQNKSALATNRTNGLFHETFFFTHRANLLQILHQGTNTFGRRRCLGHGRRATNFERRKTCARKQVNQ